MSFFHRNNKKAPTPKELIQQVKNLEAKLENLSLELESVKKQMEKSVEKIGIVRFNPFREIGGDQSFVIALLNRENTGVVITSHYGKDFSKVYAKPVKNGSSEYALSDEEKEAMTRAMSSGNPKS
jgi:regulator of replication initiation timing